MTQEKLERMKASIKEAGEMPLVNDMATPVATDPASSAPVADVAAPMDPAATPDSFTPPAPGMVPSGWVRPEDLASVVTAAQDEQDATAQATGDVEAAQSIEVPEAPTGSEIVAPAEPVVESMLPKDGERKTPVSAEEEVAQEEELAKKKMKESEEDDEDEVSEDEAEEDDDKIPGEVDGDEVVNDDKLDAVKDEFDPPADDEEECEDCEPMETDVLEVSADEDIPEVEDLFDNSNFLDKLEAFFDDRDSEDVADLAAALHDSADFLDYLLGDDDGEMDDPILGDDDEDDEDSEELEESDEMDAEDHDFDGRIPFEKRYCDKPMHKDIRSRIEHRRAMSEAVKYPAGSEPEASQIANARRQQQVNEENLVKTYEEKVQARKDALRKVRENIKKSRNVNAAAEQAPGVFKESGRHSADRFKEAIRGRSDENRVPTKKTSSWEDNKFIDRYTERQKFNFRDLLNDGTITNLLG